MQWMRLKGTLGALLLAGTIATAQTLPVNRTRVSANAMAGQLLTKIAPVYPAEARSARIEGVVVLQAIIGTDGTVRHLDVVSGNRDLCKSALDAVGQWTYKPFLLNGVAVEADTTISVRFTLADAAADPGPAKPVNEVQDPAPADVVRVSGAEMQAHLVTRVNPTYPPDAKAKGVSGAVVLATNIGKDGTVLKLTVIGGPEDLRDSALEAVRQWTYKPYLLNGRVVPVQTIVTVNFTLGG